MTPALSKYLTEWYEWATGDAVDEEPFSRMFGLCDDAPLEVRAELKALLYADFGDADLPFGVKDYFPRFVARTQHQCPKRLAWVASKIFEGETR